MPALEQLAKITGGPIVLKYNEWWGGIVEVDGVSNDHQVPTNKALHTPYKKRVKLSRSEVVTSLRNKVGAHYDREVDQVTQRVEDQLIRSLDVVVSVDGLGSFNQAETPDAFRFKNSRAQAIVRHIAFELSASAANWDF
jgi:hypothetical protein